MLLKLKKLFFGFLKTEGTSLSSVFHFALLHSRMKKTTLFVVFFFCILGTLLPVYFAKAFLWEGISDYVFAPLLSIFPAIANLVLQFALLLLSWVTSEGFISWPYTIPGPPPDGNPIIEVGWKLTRDLANMFLVLVLVIIGLGTALKIGEYEVKKTLPRLIGIALLINFTPIITGVVVDASNILMNFFLEKLSGFDAMGRMLESQYSIIAQTLRSGGIILGMLPAIFQANLLAIFDLLAAVVVLMFAVLFMVRYAAIWLLVILSPIAFASYVLPKTSGFFSTWWKQFVQWSIIGAVAAFFLYLGNHIMVNSSSIINRNSLNAGANWSLSFTDFVQSIMPIGIALIFLGIGFFVAMASSAMGSGGIISFAQKQTRAAGNWARGRVGGMVRGVPLVSRAEGAVRRRMETMPVVGGIVGGRGAFAAGLNRERKAQGQNFESMTPAEIRDTINQRALTRADRLQRARGLEVLADRGEITAEDIRRHGAEAIRYGLSGSSLYNRLPNADPNIQQRVSGMDSEDFSKNVLPTTFGIATPPPLGSPPGTPPTYTHTNQQLDVFYAMDIAKIQRLGQRGNRAKRQALYSLVVQRLPDINQRMLDLAAAGNAAEFDRIDAMATAVLNDPNYVRT